MNSIYFVMPAYNEEGNIENVVKQWYPLLDGKGDNSRLVIADSGSTDKTHEILVELKDKYPLLEILDTTNKLHGPKVIALYDYAIKNGVDYIFQTDSDGQTNPDEFDEFWQLRNDYDAIIGKRLSRGDGRDRAFVEKVVCLLLKIIFGIKVPDANAPFRLMKTNTVAKYLYKLPKEYNIPNIMMTTYFAYHNENILFKEISFKPRQAGENSINFAKITKIGIKAVGDFRHLKKEISC